MQKKAASRIMLTLLLTSMLALAFNVQFVKAEPRTWTVDDDGPADFHTIQEAINAANPGDTVLVKEGTYYENVIVSKTLSLNGEGSKTVVIDGNSGLAVQVTVNNVAISGFTIRHGIEGIRLSGFANSIISNNITNNNLGIVLYYYSSSNMIVSNDITDNFYYGIELDYSSSNTIYGNNITRNGHGISSVYSSNNNISSNKITNNSVGVDLSEGSSNSLHDNKITNNNFGIELYRSSNNIIAENNITANNYNGIETSGYHPLGNNIISGNNIAANNRYGILLYGDYNTISLNKITVNKYGIGIAYASYNTISGNDLTANSDCDIFLLWESSDNTIFHNNFIDNTIQVNVEQLGYGNAWDDGYPSGGNYWSDYSTRYPSAQELDDSGIWDAPYVIDESNQDNYPLMEPWTPAPPTATVLAVSPTSIIDPLLGLGSILHINITVADVQDLAGYELILSYNTSILTAIGCGFDPFFDYPIFSLINDQEGYVYLVAITWSDVGLTTVTPKPIAWIEFSVDSMGMSSLDLHGPSDGSLLGNSMAQPIPHMDVDGLFDNRISIVTATPDVDPDTLNLESKGKWITAYIQLPEGYSASDIDASAILLDGTIAPVLDPKYDYVTNSSEYLVDHNNDGILERMVKFDKAEVASWIHDDLNIQYGNVTLTVTGELYDGTRFEATDTLKVLFPGDADDDGDVDFEDFIIFSGSYGIGIENPCYVSRADFNEDEPIDFDDFIILAGNYGKTTL